MNVQRLFSSDFQNSVFLLPPFGWGQFVQCSERPKPPKSVSAETEISAKVTETSAEISAETVS